MVGNKEEVGDKRGTGGREDGCRDGPIMGTCV